MAQVAAVPKKTRSTRSSDQDGRDYCGIALAYAKRAADEKNRARFGKWIRLAARRYIRDLDRAGKRGGPFYFDRDEAVRALGALVATATPTRGR